MLGDKSPLAEDNEMKKNSFSGVLLSVFYREVQNSSFKGENEQTMRGLAEEKQIEQSLVHKTMTIDECCYPPRCIVFLVKGESVQ